jgi:hypothetical protein
MVDRVTVYEAARRLGISEAAVRQRLHRGTLQSDKDENGKVYVYLTADDTRSNDDISTGTSGLVSELKDRIRFLEAEVDSWKEQALRKDTIILQMNQTMSQMASRIPELEPASESSPDVRESPVTASGEEGKGQVPPEPETAESEPWWRRIFR